MPPTPAHAAPKPRPYKRILTSTLHTRFVQAASLTFIWNLGLAYLTSEKHVTVSGIFWSFFPLGPAGIKAALFTLSCICIFILEIATLKVGRRTTASNLVTLKSSIFRYSTYAVYFWYLISAWWFCEVYVFTAPASKELGWVLHRGYGEADKLNERPVYLRMFFLLLGFMGATSHLFYDLSSLHIQSMPQPSSPQKSISNTHTERQIVACLREQVPSMMMRSGVASGICTVVGPFLYTGVFRNLFWTVHVALAKVFVSLARSDAHPPGGFYIGSIMVRAGFFGFLLSLTWEITVLSFHTYMIREPTKKGLPLSASSKDPNGTLMNGIAAKNDMTKTFALWEFAVIAQSQPDRRKAIFADIDRPTGPVFKSMLDSALKVVASIDDRVNGPHPSVSAAPIPAQQDIKHLPRLLPDAQKYDKSIYASPPGTSRSQRVGNFLQKEAQMIGSSPKPWSPPIDVAKQKYQNIKDAGVQEYSKYDAVLTQTALGQFMLTKPERVVSSDILGSPMGNAAIIVDAVEAVTRMLVASLNEDTFGKAVACVPGTVKQFTKTINIIEAAFAKHSSDLSLRQQQNLKEVHAELKEVLTVHGRLKTGLTELLGAFHVFLNDVGLAIKDLNEAKAAAANRDILPPLPEAATGQQNGRLQGNKQPNRGSASQEMEQVGGVSRRPAQNAVNSEHNADEARRERQQSGSQIHRNTSSRQKPTAAITSAPNSAAGAGTGFDRPGRLFSQLDPGSAYSEKFQSHSKVNDLKALPSNTVNTAPARLRSGNTPADMTRRGKTDNVFGARDPNTSI